MFTDGSLKTVQQTKIAISAVYIEDNNPANQIFWTVETQSVFNAEVQAAECALYSLSLSPTIVVTDSKSLTSTMIKLLNLVKQNKILLPINTTIQQTQEFAFNTVY